MTGCRPKTPAPQKTSIRKKAKRELGVKSEGKCSGNRALTMVRVRTRRDLNDCHIQKEGGICGLRRSPSSACENRSFKIMRTIDSTTEACLVRKPCFDNTGRPNLNEP